MISAYQSGCSRAARAPSGSPARQVCNTQHTNPQPPNLPPQTPTTASIFVRVCVDWGARFQRPRVLELRALQLHCRRLVGGEAAARAAPLPHEGDAGRRGTLVSGAGRSQHTRWPAMSVHGRSCPNDSCSGLCGVFVRQYSAVRFKYSAADNAQARKDNTMATQHVCDHTQHMGVSTHIQALQCTPTMPDGMHLRGRISLCVCLPDE